MIYGGLRSLALRFPSRVVTNSHWHEHHPDMVAQLEQSALNRTWSPGDEPKSVFDATMRPYLADPFRGCKQRYWLADGESETKLEADAGRDALAAAGLDVSDVDYLMVGSFPPPQINVGNAAYVARELGVRCPSVNVEATCSSTLIALQLACALIQSGQAKCVLSINSCWYSRPAPSDEVVSIANGDGVCAMVVTQVDEPFLLAAHTINTSSTCDALRYELDLKDGKPCVRMRLQRHAGRVIREAAERCLKECVHGALDRANVSEDAIRFFGFNAAAAWLVPFSVATLGIDPERTINTHSTFANTGPVLVPTSLFYGAKAGQFGPSDTVMMFGIGNTSNASAMVVRWGKVALAATPVPLLDPI